VPTWNYATVHAWGRPVVIEDQQWLRRQIDDLTDLRERGRAEPWSVADAPPPFVAGQIKGIIGIEIEIERIEGKWKVSQNRSHADREGVVAGLGEQGDGSAAMAELVAERNRR
jgi:transcriptional regulator